MHVEVSPRPETGPSTDTPCAISATPHKADVRLGDSHICLEPWADLRRSAAVLNLDESAFLIQPHWAEIIGSRVPAPIVSDFVQAVFSG
jgi:hypothetical protein